MNSSFEVVDYLVFLTYALIILTVGLWVSRNKDGKQKNAEDYFLASKSLPWWAIGASLIAANISAEQFIGMSGSGFALGLAIASYEWMAAITLIIVGKYFLPIFNPDIGLPACSYSTNSPVLNPWLTKFIVSLDVDIPVGLTLNLRCV